MTDTRDEWDVKALELCLSLIRRGEPKAGSPEDIAAALRSAYERGVEDSAGAAKAYAEIDEDYARRYPDEGDRNEQRAHRARSIEAAIRALKGERR